MIVLLTSSSSFRQRVLLPRQPRLRGFVYLLRRVEVSFNLSFVLSTHSTCVGLFLPTKLFFNVVRDARCDFGQYGGALLLEQTSRPTSLVQDLTSSSILHLLHLFFLRRIYLSCLLPFALSLFSPTLCLSIWCFVCLTCLVNDWCLARDNTRY